jgi:hypothetical protein
MAEKGATAIFKLKMDDWMTELVKQDLNADPAAGLLPGEASPEAPPAPAAPPLGTAPAFGAAPAFGPPPAQAPAAPSEDEAIELDIELDLEPEPSKP